jgi:hypothetical protein
MLERAASVPEMATAVQRPRSTVAHHVNVLVDAGLVRVIRTPDQATRVRRRTAGPFANWLLTPLDGTRCSSNGVNLMVGNAGQCRGFTFRTDRAAS